MTCTSTKSNPVWEPRWQRNSTEQNQNASGVIYWCREKKVIPLKERSECKWKETPVAYKVLKPEQDSSLWISPAMAQHVWRYDRLAPRACRIIQKSHYGIISHSMSLGATKYKIKWATRVVSAKLCELQRWLHTGEKWESQPLWGFRQNDSAAKDQSSLPIASVPKIPYF